MVGLPIESVKLLFDLSDLTEKQLDEKISTLNKTFQQISISLNNSIKVYKNLINTDARDIGFDNVLNEFAQLNDTEGIRLFVYLFGYYQNKFFINQEGISLSNIINIFTFIDKFPQFPQLPWPKVNGFLLFNDKTEKRLRTPGNHPINVDEFYGRIKILNSEQDLVIGNLSNPEVNSRKNEILKLFIHLKIAECVGIKPKIEYLDLISQKIIKEDKNGKIIKHKDQNIDLDKYVSKLFQETYEDTLKDIQNNELVPKNVDPEDFRWEELLNQAKNIKDQLLHMKNIYREVLEHFEFEKKDSLLFERNSLLIEMRKFLNENKDKEKYIHFKIDERIFPDRKIIEYITGGSGLMKRISALDGGVIEFKRIYPEWILNRIDREKARNINQTKIQSLTNSNEENFDTENLKYSNTPKKN